jgi:spore photoproduct lyase
MKSTEHLPHFEKIYIDPDSEGSEVAARIRSLYPAEIIKKSTVEDEILYKKGMMTAEQFSLSKKTLWVTVFRGQFFKRCPGATQKKALTCCNYHVLNLGSQCNMNCSYCYLQSYLNSHVSKIYSNIDDALLELKEMAENFSEHPFRVGTGEVIDSLSLDELTLYSRKLISFFNSYPNWNLEFKTKSAKVDQFLDLKTTGNTTVSWSINPQYIISSEEHGTASLAERLNAAEKCLASGFKISFHIDPMIWHPDWKENYSLLAEELKSRFKPQDVHVISLGTLRFQPEQKQLMRERFGMNSLVTRAEMFKGEGDKLRYDSGLRSEMFQFMIKKMKSIDPNWNIFLCMETPETWIQSFEKIPMQLPELRNLFKPLPQVRNYQE